MLLLVIIYLGFVALGLPDSLFGTAWPVLGQSLGLPLSFAGFVTATVSIGTIVASLLSDRLTSRFGTGRVTAVSVAMTAVALIGFSVSSRFWMLVLFAVPLGLGAGAVDAALNNFVALHFKSKHMSWLHCFWGVGASISPYIMSFWLSRDARWDLGYRTVGMVQLVFTAVLLLSLPLWRRVGQNSTSADENRTPKRLKDVLKLKGLAYVLVAFFSYCALESVAFSWTSSFLHLGKSVSASSAAGFASLFYLGMTTSRLVTGFFTDRVGDKRMIRFGYCIVFLGIVCMLIPLDTTLLCLFGLFVTGFGCGPIYPAVIHSAPESFGKENSQSVIGLQMAFAYGGTVLTPPVFGILADAVGISVYPICLFAAAVIGFVMIERSYKR